MHSNYLVRGDSNINTARGAVQGESQQIFLSSSLKNAEVTVFDTPRQRRDRRLRYQPRQSLVETAARAPHPRVLQDDFLGPDRPL